MHKHFPALDGVPKVFFKISARLCILLKVARIEPVLCSSATFRCVKRQIGGLDEVFRIQSVIGCDGNSSGSSDCRSRPVYRIRLGEHLDHARCQFSQLTAIVDIWQNDLELIAAKTPDFPFVFANLLQASRDLLQQFITGWVTKRIIDLFEPIQIQHDQGTHTFCVAILLEYRFEPPAHAQSV